MIIQMFYLAILAAMPEGDLVAVIQHFLILKYSGFATVCSVSDLSFGLTMYVSLAARIFLALIFLTAGINHVTGFEGFVSTIASKGLPLPAELLAIGSIVCLLGGAVSLILGFKTKIGALLLIFFLIPTSLLFHPPTSDLLGFLKNLALVGGLLMTIANGPGLMSVDAKMTLPK